MLRNLLLLSITACCIFSCADQNTTLPITDSKTASSKRMDSITAQIAQARSFQDVGQFDKASVIVDAMLKKYPAQLDALSIKADILKSQGKAAESLAVLEKAYSFQPHDKDLAYDLAYEYADQKNAKALSLTDTLLKYDKTETIARAWYIRGTYYNNTGNEKEAMRYYDSSMIADFNFIDAYLDKGKILFNEKKYEAALKTFALGQKIAPATADFYLWVAKTQEAMGNKADAKDNYERAYGLDKTMTEAKDAAERIRE